jgi:CRISPR-associated protein Cmr6
LPSIHAVTDWGQLDQKMKDAKLIEYQAQPEIAQALRDVAAKVRDNHKKKWTPDRDAAVAEWLQPSGIAWEPLAKKNEQTGLILSPEEQAAVDMIEKLSDWGAWKNAHIALETLPLPAWEKLRYKFKVWGCDGKKAKDDKKQAWKNLNILLRQG